MKNLIETVKEVLTEAKKPKAGLKKAKFQYVGNAMELKQLQKSVIGRYD